MDRQSGPPEVLQLRISLDGISPEIWRRVLVLSSSTLYDLHHTIQIAMGWEDDHLNQFQIHGKSYGVYHDGGMSFSDNPKEIPLSQFAFRLKERFLYQYDFGDNWEHTIRVEKRLPADPRKTYPVCIGGKRRCPLEDCGGPWGFMEQRKEFSFCNMTFRLEEIIEDILDHPELKVEDYSEELEEMEEWAQRDHFDQREANRRLKAYVLSRKKEGLL